MKRSVIITLALALCLSLLSLGCLAEEAALDPGLSRGKTALGYDTMQHLAQNYGLTPEEIDWTEPAVITNWYTPADPKPLNAYIVTSLDCEVGINKDDMYPVSEKGLVSSITKYLEEWAGEIEEASRGAIRFVKNPDEADILISARQLFKYHGSYSGGGYTTKGYSSEVTFFAYHLSDHNHSCNVQRIRKPGQSTTLSGHPSKFWKNPPDFENTQELEKLVSTILGWYGGNARVDDHSGGVLKARQALIDRGYLKGVQGNFFDAEMEDAVKLLQKDYGLEETGVIDPVTLAALYYDRASVEEQLAQYPLPAIEE